MSRLLRRIALPLCLAISLPALAQVEERPGVTVYEAVYFTGKQPNNAREMLDLVPGFRVQGGNSGIRGFSGATGNVLIDGQLPTSKEEGVDEILKRIPANAVARIELIRSGAAGYDMQGYGLLANVVRSKSAAIRGRAEFEWGAHASGRTTPPSVALHVTRLGAASTLDLSASYSREIQTGGHGYGVRNRFLADGSPLRLAAYENPEMQNTAQASAQYRQTLWTGEIGAGLVVKQERTYSDIAEHITFPAPLLVTGQERNRGRSIEGQVEYKLPLGATDQLQLIAIHRSKEQRSLSIQNAGFDVSHHKDSVRETIARGDWRRQDGALTLESGAEGAINILNSGNAVEQGGVPVPLPAANVHVDELRAEFFATGTWRFNPVLDTALGARYEISTLSQAGDTHQTKNLSFFKPRSLTTWHPAEHHELRLLFERDVGQLNFGNFVSSTNLANNSVTAGNKDLEPDRTFRAELTWEYHFWDRASLTLAVRRESVAALVDHIPVFANGRTFDATGNIGSGRRDELDATVNMPLDQLDLTGVTLQAEVNLRHSKVRDLVTGQMRRISRNDAMHVRLDLTHDLPQYDLRWGGSLELGRQYITYKVDEEENGHPPSRIGLFVEYKPSPDWTVRVYGRDLGQTADLRQRFIYTGLRGSAPLNYEERRSLNNGAFYGVRLQYNFEPEAWL